MPAVPAMPATATDPRARLLGAALAVLDEDGVEGLTLRAIARRAEVSHGAPLKHFPHRAALLSAVATAGFRELNASAEAAVRDCPEGASATARLRAGARGYVAYALERPAMFALMFRHDLLDPQDKELSRVSLSAFDDRLLVLVRAAQADGWHPEADSRALTGALWSGLHGLVQLWLWGSLALATGAPSADAALDALFTSYDLKERRR
ncbi:TetR/AcrR family transcriptional regulator [Streptomyces sp. NPDC046977]|uniref:TetR/AcrR family transcriptional regulator n=1 Tax=Streptomyces sp. NPDC046977 TaxID=3154703 RepID=UPI0034022A40